MKKKLNSSEEYLTSYLYDQYHYARINQEPDDADFSSVIDMLECKRTEKDYEWLSDVFLPEYASIHLTEAAQWVQQYFPTRDFVEVYLSGNTPEEKLQAEAAKQYINAMLNVKDLYHYQKYVRTRSISSIRGSAYVVCSWKQELRTVTTTTQEVVTTGVDEEGNPIQEVKEVSSDQQIPIVDRFEYEVVDPRNVFTDNKYAYSIQDKEWVAIRSEMSYDELKSLEKQNGYINLDLLKAEPSNELTDTDKETNEKANEPKATPLSKLYDVVEFFRKIWAVVKETDEFGNPTKIDIGYTDTGKVKPNAELVEAIVTIAYSGNKKVLIRHQATPFITSAGKPYRPIIRALCYIHPTKDVGISDGKYGRELQSLINDMLNMGIDRSKLSMMPTLITKRMSWEDNDSLYFEPEHSMVVEDVNDIKEFKIDGDITPVMNIVGLAKNSLQQLEAVYPTTMGDLPGKASTTATAIAGAAQNTNLRSTYKSLTFEYTFLVEFYWQTLQMGYQFMHPITAMKILGPLAPYFNPEADYNYQPVTSNIEQENSKYRKIQLYDQLIGRLSGMAKVIPQIIPIIAYMIGEVTKLMGAEYQNVGQMLEQLTKAKPQPEGQGQGAQQPEDMNNVPMSNQNNTEMTEEEIAARNSIGQGMI